MSTIRELKDYVEDIPEDIFDPGQIIYELSELIYKLPDDDWTSVESGNLPPPGKDVWIWTENSKTGGRAHIIDNKERKILEKVRHEKFEGVWWDDTELFHPINNVTHWRHLPLPPINN